MTKGYLLYDCISRISKSIETEKDKWLPELGRVGYGVTANRYRVSFWRNENVLKLSCGHDCITLNTHSESCTLKRANYMLCELYLNEAAIKKKTNQPTQHPSGFLSDLSSDIFSDFISCHIRPFSPTQTGLHSVPQTRQVLPASEPLYLLFSLLRTFPRTVPQIHAWLVPLPPLGRLKHWILRRVSLITPK